MTLLDDIEAAQRDHERDLARAEASREYRDGLIVKALAERQPHKAIMAHAGLSRTRLNQIKKGTR